MSDFNGDPDFYNPNNPVYLDDEEDDGHECYICKRFFSEDEMELIEYPEFSGKFKWFCRECE